jgi:dynein assembly factor 3
LRFKDRDDMEDVVSSYLKKYPFEMEKLRDHRLRHHYAERYDSRKNVVDWDYNFNLKEIVKLVSF